MNDLAIKVENVTKIYHLYDKPQDRMKEALHPFRKSYHQDFYALNNVSFEIKKGETVGIIGKNGAGKSTLLKMITGVLTQSSGKITVNGKIASLLELGAGFNPEMTGYENIYLNGSLMGITKDEMDTKVNAILEFAEIGEFINQAVKMYSSGMFARLAFSVAINVDPDILIIDEALSVGDMRFQQKCYRKFREFQEAKKTILFVTHDTGAIINYCSNVIWINEGTKVDEGYPEIVCKRYMSVMVYDQKSENLQVDVSKTEGDSIEWTKTDKLESFGDKEAIITGIVLYKDSIKSKGIFTGGEKVTLKIKLFSYSDIDNLIVGFIAHDYLGNAIFGTNTHLSYENKINFKTNKEYIVTYTFEMPMLGNGDFTISPAIAEGTQGEHIQHHWIHNAITFKILSNDESARLGILIRDINIKIGLE